LRGIVSHHPNEAKAKAGAEIEAACKGERGHVSKQEFGKWSRHTKQGCGGQGQQGCGLEGWWFQMGGMVRHV
jgi:hypothetical protein